MRKAFLSLISVAAALVFAGKVEAATLNVGLGGDVFNVGDRFSARIYLDSEGVSVNAAQATLEYPADILEALDVSRAGSIFTFWLVEPDVSAPGRVSFVGGTTSGYNGKALQVLTITFRVKSAGSATLTLNDVAVTIADGTGANVLRATGGARLTAQAKVPSTAVGVPVAPPPSAILPPPVQIAREAVPSKVKPVKPAVEVPLYPAQDQWHDIAANFLAKWNLPPDVAEVATALNKVPGFNPEKTEGLFDNKMFARPDDGISYLHIRFKNNVGFGPTAHYRLAIDTFPPAPFEVAVREGTPTDVPAPTVSYESADQLSGLSGYAVRVDSGDLVETDKTSYVLPLLTPGKHLVRVSAKDKAGNMTEEVLNLEILPIAAPLITSVSRDVFVGEGGLTVSGKALPEFSLLVSLKRLNGEEIFKTEMQPDAQGAWLMKFDEPLKKDKYFVEVTAKDKRGALSLPVKSDIIRVRERPLLTVRGVEVTQSAALVGLIVLLLTAFAAGWNANRLSKKQRRRKVTIAQRDTAALVGLLSKDLDRAIRNYGNGLNQREAEETKQLLNKMDEKLRKLSKYCVTEIGEIEK